MKAYEDCDCDQTWDEKDHYEYDGYTLYTTAKLKDNSKMALCVEKGTDEAFRCWVLHYDSAQSPKIVEQYTSEVLAAQTYAEPLASQDPTYSEVVNLEDTNCWNSTSSEYIGGGIGDCFGISVGEMYNDGSNDVVDINAYLFLPKVGADSSTEGYRWQGGDVVDVWIVLDAVGNKKTEVTLALAAALTVGLGAAIGFSSLI